MMIHLPVDDFLPQILTTLKTSQNLVITAAPGAGKTTRLPPALLKAVSGKILVLEPRRMAAIAASHRIAEENAWKVGEEIGYQVRFDNRTSKATKLIFMTEALLARQMIHDPELEGVDVVILDEFHERSMHVDLALGLLRELQQLGRNIHIIVMSATLEADKISQYLGNAPVISVPGKLYELKIMYQKNSQVLRLRPEFYDQLASVVKEAQGATRGDLLVFLPGVGEIDRGLEALSSWAQANKVQLLPLHGSLPLDDQRRALQKTDRQRVILSTNIAESSVTIDGVDTVVDSGLAKVMKQDLNTGFSRLELSRISLSSAIQRAGRAARQFPGSCYRMWNKLDENSFPKSEVAEILRSDLSESLLFLSSQGVRDFQQFSWFEKPNAQRIENALRFLKLSGAIDDHNELTEIGKKILHFPLPVRLARLLIAGGEIGEIDLAARMAAILQEKDFLRKDQGQAFLADNFECDLELRLELFQQFLDNKNPREVHVGSLKTTVQTYRQILQLAKSALPAKNSTASAEAKQHLLLEAFPDRLARRRKSTDRALMTGGRGVKLSPESLVQKSEMFICLSGVEGSSDAETNVNLASGIDKAYLFREKAAQIQKTQRILFDEEKGSFYNQEFRVLGDLPLEEPVVSIAKPQDVQEKLPEVLAANLNLLLSKNEGLERWLKRLRFLVRHRDLIPEKLHETLDQITEGNGLKPKITFEALTMACLGESRIEAVAQKDLIYFFESVIPEEIQKTLREELPAQLKVPSGSMIAIHYPEDKPPYMEVRIQEIFGWTETPKLLFAKIPVTIHLLGPNYRPVQVTSHLESFWQNAYAEVRKELRIRYPKHQWPEDPRDGIAEAKGRRRPT